MTDGLQLRLFYWARLQTVFTLESCNAMGSGSRTLRPPRAEESLNNEPNVSADAQACHRFNCKKLAKNSSSPGPSSGSVFGIRPLKTMIFYLEPAWRRQFHS